MNSADTLSNLFLPSDCPAREDAGMDKRCVLLDRLHASFARSRRALVALDLAAIREGTREQLLLSCELEEELRTGGHVRVPSKALALRENAVVEAVLLHSALLMRLQRKLQVLRNTLAGSVVNYASLLDPNGRTISTAWKRQEEI